MREWHGAVLVGPDIQWRVLLTDVYPLITGDWVYRYSFRPGRAVSFVVRPGPGMLSPYDDYFARTARAIGSAYPGFAA